MLVIESSQCDVLSVNEKNLKGNFLSLLFVFFAVAMIHRVRMNIDSFGMVCIS